MERQSQQVTSTYHYLTVDECLRLNGERHCARAISYISAGYPDWFADGSLKKAKRNFNQADKFKLPNWIYMRLIDVKNSS